jgi:hypothetical protein
MLLPAWVQTCVRHHVARSAPPVELDRRAAGLLASAVAGSIDAAVALLELGLDHPDDVSLWFDRVAQLPAELITLLARDHLGPTRQGVQILRRLLLSDDAWGTRPYNDANVSLGWLHAVASYAATEGDEKLLRYAAESLFVCEVKWNRFDQRRRTRSWLLTLHDRAAEVVADVLRLRPDAVSWYRAEGWQPAGAAPSLSRAILTVSPTLRDKIAI